MRGLTQGAGKRALGAAFGAAIWLGLGLGLMQTAAAAAPAMADPASTLCYSAREAAGPFTGCFTGFAVSDGAITGGGAVTLNIDLQSQSSGSPERDSALREPAWLNANTPASAQLTLMPGATGATARLRLRGISHDYRMTLSDTASGGSRQLSGAFQFDWRDYGMGETKTPEADRQVQVMIELTLRRS